MKKIVRLLRRFWLGKPAEPSITRAQLTLILAERRAAHRIYVRGLVSQNVKNGTVATGLTQDGKRTVVFGSVDYLASGIAKGTLFPCTADDVESITDTFLKQVLPSALKHDPNLETCPQWYGQA